MDISWAACGSSSFVELVTGINIALCSWEHFQSSVRAWEKKIGESIAAALVTEIDNVDAQTAAMNESCKNINGWIEKSWKGVKLAAFVCAGAGVIMLYLNKFCRWDFLLLAPLAFHWVSTAGLSIHAKRKIAVLGQFTKALGEHSKPAMNPKPNGKTRAGNRPRRPAPMTREGGGPIT